MAHARSPWLLLQLADGTFPSGAFAHSAGLEAACVLGGLPKGEELVPVTRFLDMSLRQAARAALPFLQRATHFPAQLAELDVAYDATLTMVGPNHASRAQGRALIGAVGRVWDCAKPLIAYAGEKHPVHHAPVFGAVFGMLGLSVEDASAAYLHGVARSILSAAVRLGLLGPLESQRVLAAQAMLLEALLTEASARSIEDAAQIAPMLEIFAALHDRLDGRMFQS